MDVLTGCFKADASSCHASFCSWPPVYTINGSPDSHCEGDFKLLSVLFIHSFPVTSFHLLWQIYPVCKMSWRAFNWIILSWTLTVVLILFPPPVSIPELPPGSSSSRLPPPQSDRAEVLPTWKIAHSYPHHHQPHPRPWRSIWATSAKSSQQMIPMFSCIASFGLANVFMLMCLIFFLQNFICQFVK